MSAAGRGEGTFRPSQARRAPHLPQNESSASRADPHAGQAYSIRDPHFPQNRSPRRRAAPHVGHVSSGAAGAGLEAHSPQRMTDMPRRRTGFQSEVRRPQSAHRRSRLSPASTKTRSERGARPSEPSGNSFGGPATPRPTPCRHEKVRPRRDPWRS